MSVPESAHRLALQKPHEPARISIARHVKKIASSPAEFNSKASPLVQEAARVIDNLPPFLIRSPKRPLTMAAINAYGARLLSILAVC
jgi:hypothetical protein